MKLGALVGWVVGACSILGGVAGCALVSDGGDGVPSAGADPRELPDGAHFEAAACGLDEMRERVCGGLAEPVDRAADAPFWDCAADPKQLTSVGPTMLFYPDTKNLEFDRVMTLRYRDEKNANCGEQGERPGECCYSRCTPLPVAALAMRGVPEGYREQVRCVDAPQGGTRHGAEEFPECPAGLAFGQEPMPLEADPFDAVATSRLRARAADFFADVPRCCYRTLARAEQGAR